MKEAISRALTTVLLVILIVPGEAAAYLDPGSGSLIFQTVVAMLAAVAYGAKVYWGTIRRWVSGRGRNHERAESGNPSDPPR